MLNLTDSQIDFDSHSEDELLDAILISVYCNRRVETSEIPKGHINQGFWGDQLDPDGQETGSDLWTIKREFMSEELAGKASQFIEESLQWLLDDGHVENIKVTVTIREDRLHPVIQIDKVAYAI